MLYLKRSVDARRDVTWVANYLDESTRRNRALYIGLDVNGAVAALVKAGMPKEDAESQAKAEISRCQAEAVNDTITVQNQETPWR